MRYLIIGIVSFLAWSSVSTWWYVCRIKGLCQVSEVPPKPQPQPEGVLDLSTGQFNIAALNFPPGDSLPASGPQLDSLLAQILREITATPDQVLNIQPHYTPTTDSLHRNLVGKRAEALRDLLIEAGLPQEKVLVSDEESTGLSGKQDLLLEIVSQGLLVPNPLPEELKGVHRIFFNFASPIFQGNGEEREFLRQAAEFLINNPSKKIYLTGFTDDTAARENNLKLGQKRANKVKDLLTDLGVPEGQIVASSKGEDEPIGNNNTESGRMQNRRVELLIND